MRTEFETTFEAVAEPLPYERWTQTIPSTARIEHFNWMSPTPGVKQFKGHREFAGIHSVPYRVENLEFDAAFSVPLRDIQDDQTGGYALKARELASRAKNFPSRWVTKHLAAGSSRACFDGSNFFAATHNLGGYATNANLLTFDPAATDAVASKLIALHHGGPLKPLLYLQRRGPDFRSNGGETTSYEAKEVKYWIDLEGEAAYGYWWDAVQVSISDTPTVVELHTIFGNIEKAFRSFQLPKALTSEDGEYVHEQRVFSTGNLTLIGSTSLAEPLRQALGENWAPQTVGGATVATTNRFAGWANWQVSAFL